MKKYMLQYFNNVLGWSDVRLYVSKKEAQDAMTKYLDRNPWIKDVRIKIVTQ